MHRIVHADGRPALDGFNHRYPGPEHTVFMKEEELKRFRDLVNWHK